MSYSKKLPLEVQKKLSRLEAFIELNPRPVIEIDYDGNVLDLNKNAKRLFPDLKKKGPKHIYLSGLRAIAKSLRQGEKEYGRDIQIGDRWYKQRFYHVPKFKLIHLYGSDATERKEREHALQTSELRYRSLFNKISEGYALKEAIFDRNGQMVDYRFLDVNPAYENLVRLARINIVGKTAKQVFSKDHGQLIDIYKQVVATGLPARFERFHEFSGKYYEVFAYKTSENQFAVLYLDISHLKKIEKEKDNFISILSHELRNPLMPIMANIQFIASLLEGAAGADPSVLESVRVIERQAKNMADLLDDILDIARLQHQKIVLRLKTVDIKPIVKHAVQTVVPLINSRKQKLSVFFDEKELFARVDALRFEQVVVNLINNASKYTKPRGAITVTCKAAGRHITISVKDNGIGMDAKKITKIFELFSEASKPVMGIGGLGIGLNLVKSLVTMHKGTIVAHSKGKNKGSEFIVTIPMVGATASDRKLKSIKAQTPKTPAGPQKVLIVDDNQDITAVLAKILQQQGHQTLTAADGLAAVRLAKKHRPDVAVIDIGLPGMNGYKVAASLKGSGIRLIALTGYGQARDKELAKKAGFSHHLTKPVDIKQLLALITT